MIENCQVETIMWKIYIATADYNGHLLIRSFGPDRSNTNTYTYSWVGGVEWTKMDTIEQSVRVFAMQAEGWGFESQPTDRSLLNAATSVSVTDPLRRPLLSMSRVTCKNHHCSNAMSAERGSKFAVHNR